MSGLNLTVGSSVGIRSSGRAGGLASYPAASTATEAAFGPNPAASSTQGIAGLAPTNPAGVAFTWSVLSLAALMFLYWSLPA